MFDHQNFNDDFDRIVIGHRRKSTTYTIMHGISVAIIVAILIFGVYNLIAMRREQSACNARGGLMVKEMFGATCVDQRTVQRVIIEER